MKETDLFKVSLVCDESCMYLDTALPKEEEMEKYEDICDMYNISHYKARDIYSMFVDFKYKIEKTLED